MWWFNWRYLTHLKDEALSPMGYKMEQLPVAPLAKDCAEHVRDQSIGMTELASSIYSSVSNILDWLRHEFGVEKPGSALQEAHRLDADAFAAAVRKALPKSRKLSAADINRLKQEHAETVEPARRAAAEALTLERKLSDLVNAAYGLTPDDVALMWKTAPPRMPFTPP